jgi:transposase
VPDTARGIRARGHSGGGSASVRCRDVATSLIYKWRRTLRARETGFAEVVVVSDEPVAASVPVAPPAVIELEVAGKVRLRIPLTTPPTLAAAMVKALGVS